MSGSIPRAFIDDLLNRVDIVEIIDSRVPLKKKGREYWACCPFHNEKSPSFSVSPNKQFYHCFGCQQNGNAISFLMAYDHMEFPEAVESLAQHIGVEVPHEQRSAYHQSKSPQSQPLFQVMHQCSDYYQQQLRNHSEAIDYLKQRGISGENARNYGIGYAPPGWHNLTETFHSVTPQLIETGMLIQKDDGNNYDRFRHRLMFPIRDRRGNTIAFGGRIINPEDNPKYLNSPETSIFHKGDEIYGLFELKKYNTQIDYIFITEGYMDVIALAEHGVTTAVATLGTAINAQQIEKLFRLCKNLVFCFDGDSAGKKAAWRALENSITTIKEGHFARFLFLPDGHDPDTYIQQYGKQDFLEQAAKASTLSQFLIQQLVSEGDIMSMEGRTLFIDKLIHYANQLPVLSIKEQILQQAERLPSIKTDSRSLDRLKGIIHRPQASVLPEQHWTPVRLAINLLFQQPTLAQYAGNLDELAEADIPGMELLLVILDHIHEQPEISPQNLLSRFQGHPHETHLFKIAAMTPAIQQEEDIQAMFVDAINRLRPQYHQTRFQRLQQILMSGQKLDQNELQEYRQLLSRDKK